MDALVTKLKNEVDNPNLGYLGAFTISGNNTSSTGFRLTFRYINSGNMIKMLVGYMDGDPTKTQINGSTYSNYFDANLGEFSILVPKYNLTMIQFSNLYKRGAGKFYLEELAYCTNLTDINLTEDDRLSQADSHLVGNLSELKRLTSLKTLIFNGGYGITGGIADCKAFPDITTINVNHTSVDKDTPGGGDIDDLATAIAGTRNDQLQITCNGRQHYLNNGVVTTPVDDAKIYVNFNGSGGYTISTTA